ncbi:MAG: glycosyltransferase family protein [Candidatus Portnoybacteria bacterium]|nr:glycosyltransferase family protein [Candidatus Portnoybacteria bacterium]
MVLTCTVIYQSSLIMGAPLNKYNPTLTAIIQARVSSKRLPRKILLPLGGKAVLEQVVERSTKAKSLTAIVIATSTNLKDDAIAALCKKRGIKCFRGSLDDVLDRYYQCAKKFSLARICRITADCPLIDPKIIDRAASIYANGKYDYVSTSYPLSTFPDGLDVEIFSFEALEKAWHEAKLPSEREHVTPYIWKHPNLFKIHAIKNKEDLSSYRWTLDEERDYEFLNIVFDRVSPLTTRNILRFLQAHPEVQAINAGIKRNEGYKKSLEKDNQQNNQNNES